MLSSVIAACAVAYLMDFYSGVLHIALDNPNNTTMIGVGGIATKFQLHHVDPLMTYKNILISVFISMPVHTIVTVSTFVFNLNWTCCILMNIYGVLLHVCHAFSHGFYTTNPFVQWLMKHNFVLNIREHRIHHTTYDSKFCILTGWANPLVDRLYKLDWFRNNDMILFAVYTFTQTFVNHWVYTFILNVPKLVS